MKHTDLFRLELTKTEARALLAIADEGALGLLNDKEAARAYVGTKAAQDAAERTLQKLRAIVYPSKPAA
jgi:hypothetical protein